MQTKIEEELKQHFKKSPKPLKVKLVQKMNELKFTHKDISKMFGVSPSYVAEFLKIEIDDSLFKNLGSEIEKLNKLKDLHIQTLAKELELKAYHKLNEEMPTASYKDTLKTLEVLKETKTPSTQNNIQINLPDMVKKKFNFEEKK